MSTKIEWTDETWNPTTGCTKVSPGCDNCYAKTMHDRFNGPGSFDTVTLHPDRLNKPWGWRKPRKVFVNSMSDLFHKDIPDEFIAQVFAVMACAPMHTFQVLTKRHGRMRSLVGSDEFRQTVLLFASEWGNPSLVRYIDRWPLTNVWLGVSVENQQWADIRIPALIDTPAAVRFLSCEPLLGLVDLDTFLFDGLPKCMDCGGLSCGGGDGCKGRRATWDEIGWVIVGGESGQGARPMQPAWARKLRDQCEEAAVPFLFKQWGAYEPRWTGDEAAVMHRVGKKAAGRELDGRTWDEYPEAS